MQLLTFTDETFDLLVEIVKRRQEIREEGFDDDNVEEDAALAEQLVELVTEEILATGEAD